MNRNEEFIEKVKKIHNNKYDYESNIITKFLKFI